MTTGHLYMVLGLVFTVAFPFATRRLFDDVLPRGDMRGVVHLLLLLGAALAVSSLAEAVRGAGLTWIGPAPEAIRQLGNKITAREIAVRAGAPLVAGSDGPVESAAEARAFAEEHGLPIAIKAAFGGGGRGLKVVRELDQIEEAFDSAVREAVVAFGRGECFVERYLDRPRHVEAQVLADQHGTVVVV